MLTSAAQMERVQMSRLAGCSGQVPRTSIVSLIGRLHVHGVHRVPRVAPKVASSSNPSSFNQDRPNGQGSSSSPVSTSTATKPPAFPSPSNGASNSSSSSSKINAAASAAAQPPGDDFNDDPLLKTLGAEAAEDEEGGKGAGWAATLGVVGGIALLLGGGYLCRGPIKHFLDFFIQAVDDWGVWGYVAYAAVYTGLEVLAVPAIPLTMTAGAIFGPVPGTVIVSFSATVAATIAFLIARYAARDKVAKLASRNKRFAAIDRAISRNGLKFVTLLRLSPLLPLAVSNYLYGLTSVDLGSYVLGSWLGMLPGTYAYVTAGHVGKAVLTEGEGSLGVESWQVVLALGATALALGFVGQLAKQAVEEADKEALAEQQQQQQARAQQEQQQQPKRVIEC